MPYKINIGYNLTNLYPITKRSESNWSTICISRIILDVTDKDIQVDHINHNGLDNRKCNLRLTTRGENLQNRKAARKNKLGYIGVTVRKTQNKGDRYNGMLRVNGILYNLGTFDTAEEAGMAVKLKRAELMPFSREARGLFTDEN